MKCRTSNTAIWQSSPYFGDSMILYWVAIMTMYGGFSSGDSRRKSSGNYTVLIGIGALIFYFITNLLVLYGSRIREYYADKGSVELGNQPNQLADCALQTGEQQC